MIWITRTRTFDFAQRGAVMGVLNVTPDSFSDGGRWLDVDAAVVHGLEMVREGAEVIDVGGESTRPGAEPVTAEEEKRRILPVIEALAAAAGHGSQFVISVDTMKADVARAAVAAGASVINDVAGLRDPAMLAVVKESGAGVVVMHMQGNPQTMQVQPHYDDVVREVRDFLGANLQRCLDYGVPAAHVVLDPGIGFGKTVEHNLRLLGQLPELSGSSSPEAARPLLIGVSRKSFLAKVTGATSVADRDWATVALTSFCREKGARLFRVHDVKPNVEALRMTEAIQGQ